MSVSTVCPVPTWVLVLVPVCHGAHGKHAAQSGLLPKEYSTRRDAKRDLFSVTTRWRLWVRTWKHGLGPLKLGLSRGACCDLFHGICYLGDKLYSLGKLAAAPSWLSRPANQWFAESLLFPCLPSSF